MLLLCCVPPAFVREIAFVLLFTGLLNSHLPYPIAFFSTRPTPGLIWAALSRGTSRSQPEVPQVGQNYRLPELLAEEAIAVFDQRIHTCAGALSMHTQNFEGRSANLSDFLRNIGKPRPVKPLFANPIENIYRIWAFGVESARI